MKKLFACQHGRDEQEVLPKGALAIILHTCEFPEGKYLGETYHEEAIKVLSGRDEIGVIDYEGGEQWVVELNDVGDYEAMSTKINAAEPGDMPSFAPTMELGLKALEKSDAASKHMIIISDGDPVPPPPKLVEGVRYRGDFNLDRVDLSAWRTGSQHHAVDRGVDQGALRLPR